MPRGLDMPIHHEFKRTGCYLCPKQNIKSLQTVCDNYPEHWTSTRTERPNGLNARVNTAYRFLHHPSHTGRHGKAQTISGVRQQWGLTELGIRRARKLRPPEDTTKTKLNVTARWLAEHLKPSLGEPNSALMKTVLHAVSRRCRISTEMNIVNDHVQECFLRLIRRDSLRKHLESGRKVTYTHIASYAVNSAFTDIRDAGTEPVTREMLGARTEKERRDLAAFLKLKEEEDEGTRVGVLSKGIQIGESGDLVEVLDNRPMVSDILADRMCFEKVWHRLEKVMQVEKPHAWARYAGILRMQILEGLSVKEIATVEKVSPHRAATMLQEARRAVRTASRDSYAV